jgi:hypothetical protein
MTPNAFSTLSGGRKHEEKRVKTRNPVGESTIPALAMLRCSKPLPRHQKPESP